MLLVQERLAQTSAWYVTTNDSQSDEPLLFSSIDFHETPTSSKDRMVAQIQDLHFRIFGQRVTEDSPEVEANLALWSDLFAVDGSSVNAWAGLLSVLFRDPEFLTY